MKKDEYKKMHDLESGYWWFVARRKLVRKFIQNIRLPRKSNILDAGCGTGEMATSLKEFGDVTGIDFSKESVKYCQDAGIKAIFGDVTKLSFKNESFDLVTAFDLLEHVDDDIKAREFNRICKKNGKLFIIVPAYNFLWSQHDEALYHKRRYTASEIRIKVNNAGFKLEKITYVMTFLFLPILLFRFLQNTKSFKTDSSTSLVALPKIINYFLIWLLNMETSLAKRLNLPFGVSVVLIATKL